MIITRQLVNSFSITWTPSTEVDVAGYLVHYVPESALVNGTFTPNESNLKHAGPETQVYFDVAPGNYYFRIAAYDVFEDIGAFNFTMLNYSPVTLAGAVGLLVLPDRKSVV